MKQPSNAMIKFIEEKKKFMNPSIYLSHCWA